MQVLVVTIIITMQEKPLLVWIAVDLTAFTLGVIQVGMLTVVVIKADGKVGIGTSSPTESLEVNGRIRGVASVGEIKITGLQTHTQSGTYSYPFSHLSKGNSDDFAFDSTNKGLLIKKTGWYHLALTENWDTASVTGRLDIAFRTPAGGVANTIFNTDSTTYDQKEFSAFYEVTSPNTIIFVTYSTSYTVSNFFHACGKFTAYRLN